VNSNIYVNKPVDSEKFTREFDHFYSASAGIYSLFTRLFPVWNKWIGSVHLYLARKQSIKIKICHKLTYIFAILYTEG
jgi:hypothetical protein